MKFVSFLSLAIASLTMFPSFEAAATIPEELSVVIHSLMDETAIREQFEEIKASSLKHIRLSFIGEMRPDQNEMLLDSLLDLLHRIDANEPQIEKLELGLSPSILNNERFQNFLVSYVRSHGYNSALTKTENLPLIIQLPGSYHRDWYQLCELLDFNHLFLLTGLSQTKFVSRCVLLGVAGVTMCLIKAKFYRLGLFGLAAVAGGAWLMAAD